MKTYSFKANPTDLARWRALAENHDTRLAVLITAMLDEASRSPGVVRRALRAAPPRQWGGKRK